MLKSILNRLEIVGILLELIGISLILFFQMFMQEIYTHKVTITDEHMILVLMPENRMVLWIGFSLLISGFILIIIKELSQKK